MSEASVELCTAMLGLFLALPLLGLARKRSANVWLGLFVLSLALLSMSTYLSHTGVYRRFPLLWGLCDWPLATLGGFYYLYVRAMTGLGNDRRQLWHAAPLAVWLALILQGRYFGPYWLPFPIFILAFQIIAVAYAVAVLVRLKQFRRRVREHYSSTKDRDLAWLQALTVLLLVLLFIWLPAVALGGAWVWALMLGRIAILYCAGWYGLRQAHVFLPPPVAAPAPEAEAAPAAGPPLDAGADKYARSGMTDAARGLIGERLARRAREARDYLDSEVKLSDLAERIGTSPQLLSQYLNDVAGVNFFDYINGLRVAEVQKLMADPGSAERPLLDLAFAAGFNSRSTFNAAFKKKAGVAPSEWRKLHVRTSGPIGLDMKTGT